MLTTPITLGGTTYNALAIVRGAFDLQKQTLSADIALANVTSENVSLGVRDLTKTPIEVRFPPIVRGLTLAYDPTIAPTATLTALLSSFLTFLVGVETVLLDRKNDPGGLLSMPYQLGTSEYSLDGTIETLGTRTVLVTDLT